MMLMDSSQLHRDWTPCCTSKWVTVQEAIHFNSPHSFVTPILLWGIQPSLRRILPFENKKVYTVIKMIMEQIRKLQFPFQPSMDDFWVCRKTYQAWPSWLTISNGSCVHVLYMIHFTVGPSSIRLKFGWETIQGWHLFWLIYIFNRWALQSCEFKLFVVNSL